MRPTRSEGQTGFTIIELTIVVVIMGVILPILGALLVGTYRDAYRLNTHVQAGNQMMQALWYMDDNTRLASAFLSSVPSPFTDAYGPNNLGSSGGEAWSYKGESASDRVLITQSYASTANGFSDGRRPVFKDTPAYSCADNTKYYQPQLPFVTVYFVHDGTLYRRVLTDTTTAVCSGMVQSQKQSCPPYLTGTLDASCKANDEVLATNISSFSIAYYQQSTAGSGDQVDPSFTSTDPDILSSVDYAIVTLTERSSNGTETTLTQRLTKVNQ